jgi:hypothetical protein
VSEKRPPADEGSPDHRMAELARLIAAMRRVQRGGTADEVRRTIRNLVEWFTDQEPERPGPPTRE